MTLDLVKYMHAHATTQRSQIDVGQQVQGEPFVTD